MNPLGCLRWSKELGFSRVKSCLVVTGIGCIIWFSYLWRFYLFAFLGNQFHIFVPTSAVFDMEWDLLLTSDVRIMQSLTTKIDFVMASRKVCKLFWLRSSNQYMWGIMYIYVAYRSSNIIHAAFIYYTYAHLYVICALCTNWTLETLK